MITQAIIAAGGLGMRLRPHTDKIPKPMIPILGKPMLEWRLEQFRRYGVSEFFITLNHLPEVVMDYFGDGTRFGVKITYFIEEQPLGTAGAIRVLGGKLDELFFYGYGDVLAFIDYEKMQKAYAEKMDPVGMQHTQQSDDYSDADVVELDRAEKCNGKYIAIHPKPHANAYPNPVYRMQGTFILDKKIIAHIPKDAACNLGNELLLNILAAGENFYAYESDEEVVWVDTAEKWKAVEEYLRKHKMK